MNPKTVISPFVLAVLLAALACSSCAKVDEMHDATMRMDATTARMAANTQQMKGATDGMNDVMSGIYDSGRQGAAVDLRNKQWDLLLHAAKPDEKGAHAALFFQEFEFELWGRAGRDKLENQRQRLMKDAAFEFFGRLLSVTHWSADELDPLAGSGKPVLVQNPLKQADADNEKATFNALALTLESINRQEELVGDANPPVTMLSMIEDSLRAGKRIREGKARLSDFPGYVELVLQQEQTALLLLRARHQMMGLAVLCQVTSMCRDLGEGARYTMPIVAQRWQLDLGQLNPAQVKLVSFRLGEGVRARNLLAELGVSSELDPTVRAVFSRGSVATAHEPLAAKNDEASQAQAELVAKLQDYLR